MQILYMQIKLLNKLLTCEFNRSLIVFALPMNEKQFALKVTMNISFKQMLVGGKIF